MRCADTSGLALALCDAVSWAAHDNVEVHAENTNRRVVTCTEIDVLLNTEAKVAGLGEVPALELILLDLEATLEDLLGLGPTDGNMYGDLLVTTDAELADGVSCLRRDRGLTGELLQHLRRPRQTITRFTDGDVYEEERERNRLILTLERELS